MHAGTIASGETAAGRLYRVLKGQPGVWLDAAWLASEAARLTNP